MSKINYPVTINKLDCNLSKANAKKVKDILASYHPLLVPIMDDAQQLAAMKADMIELGLDTSALYLEVMYTDINDLCDKLYDNAVAQYQARWFVMPTEDQVSKKSKYHHILCSAEDALLISNNPKNCIHEAKTMLKHGHAFWFFNPFADGMVYVKYDQDWASIIDAKYSETAKWRNEQNEKDNLRVLDAEEIFVLNTYTPWLGEKYRLHTLMHKFPSFDDFIVYCEGVIEKLEGQPNTDWDYDMTVSPVLRAKADQSHYVVTKAGMDKGKRAFSYKEHDDEGHWVNYEVLPVDILKKFLHLTFLDSISYKPLVRLESDGVEYGTRAINTWEDMTEVVDYTDDGDPVYGYAEDGLRTTPLYLDPYATDHEEYAVNWDSYKVEHSVKVSVPEKPATKDYSASCRACPYFTERCSCDAQCADEDFSCDAQCAE